MSFTSKLSHNEDTYKLVSRVVHQLCESNGLTFEEQWSAISRKTTDQLDRHFRRQRRQTNPLYQIKQRRIAYSFFTAENRNQLAAKHPELSFGEVSKLVGQEWKKLSEKQRAKYVKLEQADKARYEAEKQAVLAQQTSATTTEETTTTTEQESTPTRSRRSRKAETTPAVEATPEPVQESAPASTSAPSKKRGGKKNKRSRK